MKRTGFAPLIIGMYTLPTGLVILLGHNIWAWDWPVVVTIAGWGMTIKATLYLIFPALPNRMAGEKGSGAVPPRGKGVAGEKGSGAGGEKGSGAVPP